MKKEPIPIKTNASIIPINAAPKDLFHEMKDISSRIAQRAYEFFQLRGPENGHDLDDWFKAENEVLQFIPVEMKEMQDKIVVNAKVPGFDAKDLNIHVVANRLIIRGCNEKTTEKKKNGKVLYSETLGKQVFRSIELPNKVVFDLSCAKLVHDKLEILLPKEKKPAKIEVNELQAKAS